MEMLEKEKRWKRTNGKQNVAIKATGQLVLLFGRMG